MEAATSSWQDLFARLASFASLTNGWNSYAAPAPNAEAIAITRTYLTVLQREQYAPTRIAPSAMGGIGVTHRAGGRKVYVEFYNSGATHALFSAGKEGMETRQVCTDPKGFQQLVQDIRNYLDG